MEKNISIHLQNFLLFRCQGCSLNHCTNLQTVHSVESINETLLEAVYYEKGCREMWKAYKSSRSRQKPYLKFHTINLCIIFLRVDKSCLSKWNQMENSQYHDPDIQKLSGFKTISHMSAYMQYYSAQSSSCIIYRLKEVVVNSRFIERTD